MNCKYCNKELPPQNGSGRPRKFCDDFCRRRYHEVRPCKKCSRLTWAEYCSVCTRERVLLEKQQETATFWNLILDLRAKGLLNHQIAKRTGRTQLAVQSAMHRMRLAGVRVPESTYDYHEYMEQYIQSKRAVRKIKS